VHLCRRSRLS